MKIFEAGVFFSLSQLGEQRHRAIENLLGLRVHAPTNAAKYTGEDKGVTITG